MLTVCSLPGGQTYNRYRLWPAKVGTRRLYYCAGTHGIIVLAPKAVFRLAILPAPLSQ